MHSACAASREPVSHCIPPALPSSREHGMVSEYACFNLPHKKYSEFYPEETLEDEVVPLCKAPSPWKPPLPPGTLSDPTLCVSPEKSRDSVSKNTLPIRSAPQKASKPTLQGVYHSDPSLALTPDQPCKSAARQREKERKSKGVFKSNLGKTNCSDSTKLKQKVRFDIDSSYDSDLNQDNQDSGVSKQNTSPSKQYKPSLYSDAGDANNTFDFLEQPRTIKYVISETSETDSKKIDSNVKGDTVVNSFYNGDFQISDVTAEDITSPDENVKSKTYTYRTVPRCETSKNNAPAVSLPSCFETKPKRKVIVTREFEERPKIEDYHFPFSGSIVTVDSEYEHVFVRPEYNSTLKQVNELQEMRECHPDVRCVLQKTLTESEQIKTAIQEKASSKVNVPTNQLSGLVSVQSQADEINQLEKEITEKAMIVKQKVASKPKPKKSEREPDLLEFFTPDLQRELPDFTLTSLTTPFAHLTTASHDSAFDLYRHNRVWEGIAQK